MPPLLSTIPAALPMPFEVSPIIPAAELMLPVKVLAVVGLRIHTPPSVLVTASALAPLLVSWDVIMLASVLVPRISNVTAPLAELVMLPSTSGPDPEESMRKVAAPDENTIGRLEVSPAPTYNRLAAFVPLPKFKLPPLAPRLLAVVPLLFPIDVTTNEPFVRLVLPLYVLASPRMRRPPPVLVSTPVPLLLLMTPEIVAKSSPVLPLSST